MDACVRVIRMIKSELIALLANQQKDLPEETVARTVNYIIKLLSNSLATGQRIEIRGFGSIDLRVQKPRKARNPRTGDMVLTQPKRKTHFKAGKELKDMINERLTTGKKTRAIAEAA
jgi:integration host factor subunit beta